MRPSSMRRYDSSGSSSRHSSSLSYLSSSYLPPSIPSYSSSSVSYGLRSSLSTPSSSTYATRAHLPYVPQSMLMAHCLASTTGPNSQMSRGTSSAKPSARHYSSSYSSSYTRPTALSNYSTAPTSSSYKYRPSSYSSSTSASSYTASSYRPARSLMPSYYRPPRLRERPLLATLSRQLHAATATCGLSSPRGPLSRTHSNESFSGSRETAPATNRNKLMLPVGDKGEIKATGGNKDSVDEESWHKDLSRSISRNKYLIKFREIDKQRRSIVPEVDDEDILAFPKAELSPATQCRPVSSLPPPLPEPTTIQVFPAAGAEKLSAPEPELVLSLPSLGEERKNDQSIIPETVVEIAREPSIAKANDQSQASPRTPPTPLQPEPQPKAKTKVVRKLLVKKGQSNETQQKSAKPKLNLKVDAKTAAKGSSSDNGEKEQSKESPTKQSPNCVIPLPSVQQSTPTPTSGSPSPLSTPRPQQYSQQAQTQVPTPKQKTPAATEAKPAIDENFQAVRVTSQKLTEKSTLVQQSASTCEVEKSKIEPLTKPKFVKKEKTKLKVATKMPTLQASSSPPPQKAPLLSAKPATPPEQIEVRSSSPVKTTVQAMPLAQTQTKLAKSQQTSVAKQKLIIEAAPRREVKPKKVLATKLRSIETEPKPQMASLESVKKPAASQLESKPLKKKVLNSKNHEPIKDEPKAETAVEQQNGEQLDGNSSEESKTVKKAVKKNLKPKIKTESPQKKLRAKSDANIEATGYNDKSDADASVASKIATKVKKLARIGKQQSKESKTGDESKQVAILAQEQSASSSIAAIDEMKEASLATQQQRRTVEPEAGSVSACNAPAAKRIRFREYAFDDFSLVSVLGHGGWGFVFLAELKEHDRYFAVKAIKKQTIAEDDDYDSIMIERKMLTLGNIHPFICKLFCTFETEAYLFFVMEFCPGGDLMFHVQHEGKFSEPRCRFYAAEIICAIRFLHNRGIVYRDLKLDNILLCAAGHIRLVDFGMCQCRTYREEMLPSNFCGTPEYIAPEIIKGIPYNHSVDWWSFGVLLYEMAIGKMPFRGGDENELLWNVCYEQIHYPMFLSKELASLLKLLLEREPSLRLGMATCKAGDIYEQLWFRGVDWRAVEEMRSEPPFVPQVSSAKDVQNFDADFTEAPVELSPIDETVVASIDQSLFRGFAYTNPEMFSD